MGAMQRRPLHIGVITPCETNLEALPLEDVISKGLLGPRVFAQATEPPDDTARSLWVPYRALVGHMLAQYA